MEKENINIKDNIDALRKLINEGFREYDGDIREEALEKLDDVTNSINAYVAISKAIKMLAEELSLRNEDLNNKLSKAEQQRDTFRDEMMHLTTQIKIEGGLKRIDFGVGALHYSVEKESALTVQELMDAIASHAMVATLDRMTLAILRCNSSL